MGKEEKPRNKICCGKELESEEEMGRLRLRLNDGERNENKKS